MRLRLGLLLGWGFVVGHDVALKRLMGPTVAQWVHLRRLQSWVSSEPMKGVGEVSGVERMK